MWLIYILVFMWTAFPTAFGAMMTTLFVPWLLVGVGIVLRGGDVRLPQVLGDARRGPAVRRRVRQFVVDHPVLPRDDRRRDRQRSRPGRRVRRRVDVVDGPDVVDRRHARRAHVHVPRRHVPGGRRRPRRTTTTWRRRWAVGRSSPERSPAPSRSARSSRSKPTPSHWPSGLQGRGAPLVVVSAVAGLFSLWRLRAGRWARARVGAVIAVAAIVVGWGVGQYPDLLVDEMTIADSGRCPVDADRADHRVRARRGDGRAGAAVAVLARQSTRLDTRTASVTESGSLVYVVSMFLGEWR